MASKSDLSAIGTTLEELLSVLMERKKNMQDAFEDFEMDPIDSGWDNLREKMMKEGILQLDCI